MTRELQPCGTVAARRRHIVNGEPICDPCRIAVNEYEALRQRPTVRLRYPAQCGTHSGYCRHISLNESACRPCRVAHVIAVTESEQRILRRKRRGTIPTVIGDYVETHGPLELRELVMLIQLRHDIDESSIRRAANRMMSNGRLIRGVDIVTSDDRAGTLTRYPSDGRVSYSVQPDTVWVA